MSCIIPQNKWDLNDNLISPCPIETAVLKALATTHDSVTNYTILKKCNYHDVDDDIIAVIISGMISIRLGFMEVKAPDMTDEMSHVLSSICKEMMDYDKSTVGKYIDYYITNGTSGFDNLAPDSDGHYRFFLFFMDIKSVVHFWITGDLAMPLDHWRNIGRSWTGGEKVCDPREPLVPPAGNNTRLETIACVVLNELRSYHVTRITTVHELGVVYN